jgi:hypothetical protein
MGDEPRIDWDAVDVIILILMRIDAKLDQLLAEEDDGEEEEDDA